MSEPSNRGHPTTHLHRSEEDNLIEQLWPPWEATGRHIPGGRVAQPDRQWAGQSVHQVDTSHTTRFNTSQHISTDLITSQQISTDHNISHQISTHLNISHHISTSQHVSMDPKIFQHISSSESFDEILFRCGMKEFERGNLIPRGEPEGEPEIAKYLGIRQVIIQM